MSKGILLTGGTGFVGRQILSMLQEKGYRIRLVIREGAQAKIENLKGIEKVITTPDLFSESSDWWAVACDGVDSVIHCAWYAKPGQYLRSEKNLECLVGTLSLAKGAALAGVKRFVGVGTCFEYANSNAPLAVESPLKPSSPYAAAKVACYTFLSEYFGLKDVVFTWCRLFYLYGDGEDARRLVPHIHEKIQANQIVELSTGHQIRDFLNVRDAADQMLSAFEGYKIGAVNICSGTGISVRNLAENIADEYGRRELLKFGARQADPDDPPFVVGVRNY